MQGNDPLNTKGCTFLAVLYIPTFLPPNWLYPKTCSLVATWWLQPFKYLHEDTTSSKNVSFGVHFPVPCCAQLLSCVQLFATPWTVAHQVPLSIGILQARILEWVVMLSSRGSSHPRDQTQVSCIAGRAFTIWATAFLMLLLLLSRFSHVHLCVTP